MINKLKLLAVFSVLVLICGCSQNESIPADTYAETTVISTVSTVSAKAETSPLPETEAPTLPETEPKVVQPAAREVTNSAEFWLELVNITGKMSDRNHLTRVDFRSGRTLKLTSQEPFGAVYMMWDTIPGHYTMAWDGGSLECGQNGFLHEYIPLPEEVTSVTLSFHEPTHIYLSEIRLYTTGSTPEDVQIWLPPCEQADVLVFPTHSDDDTLFFGALISDCVIERNLTVQTAFMVEHAWKERGHERLNGLWEMGIRHYPILGTMEDSGTHSMETVANLHKKDDLKGWQVTQIRRFRPLVIVGHDLDGEYGNGQHKLNAHYLTDSIRIAQDPDQYPETVQQYGTWETPKLYLHLYEENAIILDVNTPMQNDLYGRTPFEVAEDAYAHHVSQHQFPFYVSQDDYESGMDCKRFGLYHSSVGDDTTADIMENIDRNRWR